MSDKKSVWFIGLCCAISVFVGIKCPNIVLKIISFCAAAYMTLCLWVLLAPVKNNKGTDADAPDTKSARSYTQGGKPTMAEHKKYPENFGFGDEYAFTKDTPIFEYSHFHHSEETLAEARRLIDTFHDGQPRVLKDTGCYLTRLYTGGTYKKVYHDYATVPTFDDADREFDSYRVFVIFQDKSDQYYLATYSGGRVLAGLTVYGKLIRFPKEYEELLK